MNRPSLLDEVFIGQIVLAGDDTSPLPLEQTSITAQITGMLTSVAVSQRFGNPLSEPAELDYLFPLPHDAAVMDFELRIGGRLVRGDVQELEAARRAYEDARESGQRAGLLEQRRPNLFSVHLANVLPGETIQATLRYQQRLHFEDGMYEFVIPMGITPKYHASGHPEEAEGLDAPLALPGEPIGPVEIMVAVDAGLRTGDPTSPSHPIEITRLDERRFQVRLAGDQIPDHDFVLRYPVDTSSVTGTAWTTSSESGEIFLAGIVPPRLEEDFQPAPREFIFVLDRSGSMSGEPIAQARNALRACLRTLNPADTFRILLFDHELEWFSRKPDHVTQENINRADAFLKAVEGRGGTEIGQALEASLGIPADLQRTRYLIFLTDGAVSAEARAIDLVRRKLGSARIFTFGIGPSVNRSLLSQLARMGHGTSEFLQLDEDIEGVILRFQDRVSFPLLTDLRLEWTGAKVWDVQPRSLPDLYAGQPVEFSGRLTRRGTGTPFLTIHGKRNGQDIRIEVAIPAPTSRETVVERVWARACVDDLLDQMELEPGRTTKLRNQVIELALDHRLVTPYTAFVAIDQEIAAPGQKPRTLHVAQPLPQGLDREGFGPALQSQKMLLRTSFMSSPAMTPSTPSASEDGTVFEVHKFNDSTMFMEDLSQASRQPRSDADTGLRWLARTQRVDGSWESDVERTAAALLAFVRSGNTSQKGIFRPAVKHAFEWLAAASAIEFARLARAQALVELAGATGNREHQAAADQALQTMNLLAADLVKRAQLECSPAGFPHSIQTLDDLRLAALSKVQLNVPDSLLDGDRADLVKSWAAALQPISPR